MAVAVTTQSSGYSNVGITTLIWGTDGFLTSPIPAGALAPGGANPYAGTGYYIVESVDQETDAETIYIENGTGQKASRIIINNGQRWTLSVQDDTAMSPPQVGDNVSIKDGACLIVGTSSGSASTIIYTAKVISSGERFTRKGAAMRNITVENLALVDSQTAS